MQSAAATKINMNNYWRYKTMPIPKILIVDDEVVHLEAIIDIIEDAGSEYEILTAFNGITALEIVHKEMPDLIITDWEMPGMDGIELIKHLKNDKKTTDIPVIMCTGIMTSSENLETALNAGAVDYIRKPIDKLELIARIKANLHLAAKYREVKELNRTLAIKYHEIKMLNETKDMIFSIISHDLRGPVGTLKYFAEMILDNINEYAIEELEEYVDMMGQQSGWIYSILENLMLWANSQRQKISYTFLTQLINQAVDDNISLLHASAKKKDLQIINHIPKELTATFDTTLISIVVRNLINNAIKFTPKGGAITLSAEKGEDFHTIIIADTGVGIHPERVDKLFDKTSYETTFGTDAEKGSGLGLKLCLEFVEIHHGKIWVESELKKGSKFCFTLPVN
jgi:two-component system, sensor histidine kinase and response regulator